MAPFSPKESGSFSVVTELAFSTEIQKLQIVPIMVHLFFANKYFWHAFVQQHYYVSLASLISPI